MKRILRSHVEQWVKQMSLPATTRKQGLAASTIKTRYNYVHMAFRAAVNDRIIRHDPSSGVSLPKPRRAEAAMTIPTPEEVGRAMACVESQDFRAFIAVCAFAGLRLGEAAGLQLGDVDFLRRTIIVRRQVQGQTNSMVEVVAPKHGSERRVFIPEELTEMLSEHVRNVGVWGEEEWLFGSGGAPLNRNSAGHLWRGVRNAAGLRDYTLHDLRHFFASGLIAAGCDVVTVQSAMGHSDATTTLKVYAHLWPRAEDRTRAAAAGLMSAVVADKLRTVGTP
jgi:integrase